jgi:hypothetical protein
MQGREPERNRAGLLLGCMAMLVVVASVIGTLAATGRFTSHGADGSKPDILTGMLRIDTIQSAKLYCPSFPSFSPDGSRLMVLGTGRLCNEPEAQLSHKGNHKLAIFDVPTGRVDRVIDLDNYFASDTIQACAGAPVGALQFASLGWSPDGDHVGILFAAFDTTAYNPADALSLPDLRCEGLLYLSVDPGTEVTEVTIPGDAGFFDGATGTYAGYPSWNLTNLTQSAPMAVTPSLFYGWTKDGLPLSMSPLTGQPLTQLPARAGPGYSVGNPSEDSTYTMWQPGILAGPEVFNGGSAAPTDPDLFVTEFPAWIPSGQYATMLVGGVELASPSNQTELNLPPTPSSPTSGPLVPLLPEFTQVPARDPALAAVQQQVGVDGWAMTAWNDEGTLLASIPCTSGSGSHLEVRETSGGALIGNMSLGLTGGDPGCSRFNFSQALEDYPNPNLSMQWSPVGSRILVSDQAASTVTIWQVVSPGHA